jgi:hypothetical protein
MSGPFIFIATNRLRQGAFDAEQQCVPGLASFVETNKPRLIVFHEYVSDSRDEVTVVQVHPDAASMEFHLGIIGERGRDAYAQTLEATTGIQVFGTPSEKILRMLSQQAGSGVPLSIYPHHLGGFTRPFAKTSGGKGMQLTAALAGHTSHQASELARGLAEQLEKEHPGLVVSRMVKVLRPGKVLIDWSQNNAKKNTVAPYSLRTRERPTVSTPVTWAEVEDCEDPRDVVFTSDDVLDRVASLGDLHAPLLDGAARAD